MFNKNFYPSTEEVRELLLQDIDYKGKNRDSYKVLEPSAGKGDLIDLTRFNQSNVQVIEKDTDLRNFLMGAGYELVHDDFLTYETYTEYDLILMNPPFDAGVKHLMKAIQLAEQQQVESCEIRAILNAETLNNLYSKERQELMQKIERWGGELTYHEGLFLNGERKTNVATVIVKMKVDNLQQGVQSAYDRVMGSFYNQESESTNLERSLSTVYVKQEIKQKLHDIQQYVEMYRQHITYLKEYHTSKRNFLAYEKALEQDTYILDKYTNNNINENIERLRIKYWGKILDTDYFKDHLTQQGIMNLNRKVEQSKGMEITYKNIEMLMLAIIQNKNEMYMEDMVGLYEKITQNHMEKFSKNIHYYNGWKGNSAYKINKKIVVPFYRYSDWTDNDMGAKRYGRTATEDYTSVGNVNTYGLIDYTVKDFMQDMNKMLKLIKPNFNADFRYNALGDFENDVIRFKMFKKRTVHIWFKDEEVLNQFNLMVGRHFQWLPTEEEVKTNPEAEKYLLEQFPKMKKADLIK